MKKRKIPVRTCVGCRNARPKKELIRVVRDPDGDLHVDATGRMNGRGAYICPKVECLDAAVKNRGIERSLERSVPDDVLQKLRSELGAAQ